MSLLRQAARVSALLFAALLAGFGLSGCTSADPTGSPVLMVGVDGFEWNVLLPLVRAGRVPTLERLMEAGSYGLLETTRPTFSPIIWTSIATGKTEAEHGIHGFVTRAADGRGRRLFNSYDRKTKAFWDVLSDFDRSVAVLGWWMTYPAQPVNGLMVAQVNTLQQADRERGKNILKGGLLEGVPDQVYPAERLEEILAIHRRVGAQLPDLHRENFGPMSLPLNPLVERMWENTQWAFRADATYVEVAAGLAAGDYDVVAFYLGGPDVIGHRFWRYHEPDSYKHAPTDEEIAEYGHLIPDYYRFVDRSIARILERMPADTRVLVVSDHGMHSVNHARKYLSHRVPRGFNSGHHRDAPAGVLIAAGPGIVRNTADRAISELRREDLAVVGGVVDFTPTLLAMLGVPAGEDMTGEVMVDLFDSTLVAPVRIPTHDMDQWAERRARLDPAGVETDSGRLEQLRELGYID